MLLKDLPSGERFFIPVGSKHRKNFSGVTENSIDFPKFKRVLQPLPLRIVGSWRRPWIILCAHLKLLHFGGGVCWKHQAPSCSLVPISLSSKRHYLNQLDRNFVQFCFLQQQEHSKKRSPWGASLSLWEPTVARTASQCSCRSGWMQSPVSKPYSAASYH